MKFTILQHFFTNAWLSFVSNYYCRAFDCSRFHQYCNYIGCRFSHLPHVGVKFSLFHYDVLLFKKWIRISFAKILPSLSLSVIRQKGESQNGCFKKTKHAKFSENEHFLPSDRHEIYPFALLPTSSTKVLYIPKDIINVKYSIWGVTYVK